MGHHILTHLKVIGKQKIEADFQVFFLLYTVSFRPRPPGPTLVPGVSFIVFAWQNSNRKSTELCMFSSFLCFQIVLSFNTEAAWTKITEISQLKYQKQLKQIIE